MTRIPLKSVTVQMPSGLEFTSRVKCKGQNAPCIESLAKDDPVDMFSVLALPDGRRLVWSDPGASKDGVKQTTESSSQTDTLARKTRLSPLLCPPHSHLTKSASLDSMLFGKYRSHHWGETSGITGAQGNHCCRCCHSCCSRTYPVAVSPHRLVGCCSNHATTKLQLLKTLTLLQKTAMRNLPQVSRFLQIIIYRWLTHLFAKCASYLYLSSPILLVSLVRHILGIKLRKWGGKEALRSGQKWQTCLCTFSFVGPLTFIMYVHQLSLKIFTVN